MAEPKDIGQLARAQSAGVTLSTEDAAAVDTINTNLEQVQAVSGATAPTNTVQSGGIDANGNIRAFLVDQFGRGISSASDLIGRLQVTEPRVVQYGYAASAQDTYRFSAVTDTGGTVTYSTVSGEYEVAVTAASGSTAIHIHNQIGYYRPGFPLIAFMSGSLVSTNTTNARIEWGVTGGIASSATSLQTADAMGFYHSESVLGVYYRSSIAGGPNVNTPQTAWNIDRLDGSGNSLNPSGYNLTAAQLLNINLYRVGFLWLGAFGIAWYVGPRLVHFVPFDLVANATIEPFARTPHIRLYAYARNTGAAIINSFHYNCGTVHSLGGGDPTETPAASSHTTAVTIPAASGAVPIFALRPAATFGGITNIRRLVVDAIVVRTTTQDFRVEVWLGRETDFTLTGESWAAPPNSPRSAAERDISSTAVTVGAGATLLGGTTVTAVGGVGTSVFDMRVVFGETKASIGVNGDGVLDNLVITATALAGVNGTAALQSITWTELG